MTSNETTIRHWLNEVDVSKHYKQPYCFRFFIEYLFLDGEVGVNIDSQKTLKYSI